MHRVIDISDNFEFWRLPLGSYFHWDVINRLKINKLKLDIFLKLSHDIKVEWINYLKTKIPVFLQAIVGLPPDSTSGEISNLPPSGFQLDVRHEAIIHVPCDLTSGVISNLPPYGFQLDIGHEAIILVPRDPTSKYSVF